jgi:Protein of unknown function (DUF2510)
MASAPGWYPDPDGKGGLRYFDGADWTDQRSAPAPSPYAPRPPKAPGSSAPTGKVILAIVGAIVLMIIVGNILGAMNKGKDDSSSSSRSSSSSTVATPTGPKKPDATFTTASGPDGDEVTATFAIGDNFTEGLIKDGARFETIDILKYAKLTYPKASQVTMKGSFPMKDSYGNTSTDTVINLTYLRSTLDQINFEGVDKDKIWEIADSGYIAPAFRP